MFCKQKEHGESRASPSKIKDALETYIGKLTNGIVEADISFAVNVMFRANATVEELGNLEESGHGMKFFPQAPVIDSTQRLDVGCCVRTKISALRVLRAQFILCKIFGWEILTV